MGLCLNLHIFIYFQIKPSPYPGFHAPLSGSTQRPDQRPPAGRGTRHIISLAGRLRGAPLMDPRPSATTGSVGYSLPPWSLRFWRRLFSSSAWSLRERWKPLLFLAQASFVSLSGLVSGHQTGPVWGSRLSSVSCYQQLGSLT